MLSIHKKALKSTDERTPRSRPIPAPKQSSTYCNYLMKKQTAQFALTVTATLLMLALTVKTARIWWTLHEPPWSNAPVKATDKSVVDR